MAIQNFTFDRDKLIQALVFFSKAGINDLTKLKAAKLLYYADKYHLLKYGRPVIGDNYVCMDYGPVPTYSYNIMNEAERSKRPGPIVDAVRAQLEITGDEYPVYKAKSEPDLDVFSDSDIEALEHVVKLYGDKRAWDLVDLTHEEATWQIPDNARSGGSSPIPWRLFFEGADSEDMYRIVDATQEDRDFVDFITSVGGR